MSPPQRVDGVEEDKVTGGNQEEEHTGRTRVHRWKRERGTTFKPVKYMYIKKKNTKATFLGRMLELKCGTRAGPPPNPMLSRHGKIYFHEIKAWNVPQPPGNLQEPKKEVQGVGHFLGVGLGSPMGKPFMCR